MRAIMKSQLQHLRRGDSSPLPPSHKFSPSVLPEVLEPNEATAAPVSAQCRHEQLHGFSPLELADSALQMYPEIF